MTGAEPGVHQASGSLFPTVRGGELRRVQQRLLTSLLRQPALVPIILATGISHEHFPEEWRNAFILATKERGRVKQTLADPNCDVTIRRLYAQIVLLGDGQARQLAEQILISTRGHDHALRAWHESTVEVEGEDLDEEHARGVASDSGFSARDATKDSEAASLEGHQAAYRSSSGVNGPSAGTAQHQGRDSAPKSASSQGYPRQETPEQQALRQAVDPDLTKMNEQYAVIRIGGKTRVVWFEQSEAHPGCTVAVFSTINDFRAFHAHPKKIVARNGKLRRVGIGQWWIDHERRRQYNGLIYAPNVDAPITSGKLNLWKGFSCKPRPGKCDLFLAHLQHNVCCGNRQYYGYLLDWMADATQHPDRQGGVAVVMRGKEGTGKGVAAKQFGQLFGSHFRHIVHAKHLTGHFNAHLQHCSLLFADEAFYAGDRSHEPILKALITEETFLIEPKGIDPFPVRNCVHLIMSSNNDWVIPAGADARRYFVLDVGDAHMQDHPYFAAIAYEMENGGREALLHLLLSRDLKDFNVRRVPQTEALAEQKTHSRRGVDRLVEIVCHNGHLPWVHDFLPDVAVTSGEEDGEGFYSAARKLVPDFKHVSSIVISRTLKKHWECASWKAPNKRGIQFPPLARLRELFDERHGKQEWPDPAGETVEWSPRSSLTTFD
jgi:Family of unknown function (DUF5906)